VKPAEISREIRTFPSTVTDGFGNLRIDFRLQEGLGEASWRTEAYTGTRRVPGKDIVLQPVEAQGKEA
jgi:hypothetical protein